MPDASNEPSRAVPTMDPRQDASPRDTHPATLQTGLKPSPASTISSATPPLGVSGCHSGLSQEESGCTKSTGIAVTSISTKKPGARVRRNVLKACAQCRKQKTRCEPEADGCHRCRVLGQHCSFADGNEQPFIARESGSSKGSVVAAPPPPPPSQSYCAHLPPPRVPSPIDTHMLYDFLHPTDEVRFGLIAGSDLTVPGVMSPQMASQIKDGTSRKPGVPMPRRTWVRPQEVVESILSRLGERRSDIPVPIASPPELESHLIEDLREIALRYYCPWVGIPIALLARERSTFLDSILCALGARQASWTPKEPTCLFFDSARSSLAQVLCGRPSLATVCGLLLMAVWGPSFGDVALWDGSALLSAALGMARTMLIDENPGATAEPTPIAQERWARACLYHAICSHDTLLCILDGEPCRHSGELHNMNNKLSPLGGIPETLHLHDHHSCQSRMLVIIDAGTSQIRQAAQQLHVSTIATNLLSTVQTALDSLSDLVRDSKQHAEQINQETRWRLETLDFQLNYMGVLLIARAINNLITTVRDRADALLELSGQMLASGCAHSRAFTACQTCTDASWALSNVLKPLGYRLGDVVESALSSYITLTERFSPDIPTFYHTGAVYVSCLVIRTRLTMLELHGSLEYEGQRADLEAWNHATTMLSQVRQRFRDLTSVHSPLVARMERLLVAILRMWDDALRAAGARQEEHEAAVTRLQSTVHTDLGGNSGLVTWQGAFGEELRNLLGEGFFDLGVINIDSYRLDQSFRPA